MVILLSDQLLPLHTMRTCLTIILYVCRLQIFHMLTNMMMVGRWVLIMLYFRRVPLVPGSRQIPFIWYFSLISLTSSISSTKISDDKLLQKHYVDDQQLLTNVCYCYVQKHAMTVCNVAIAQPLATPTCKSPLKLTQELHFYYQICSMQHTLFIILFSFALLRLFFPEFFSTNSV